MADSLELPKDPRDTDYEEYIAAYLQAGGLYVERNAVYREEADLLELDILTTDFSRKSTGKNLIEIKSGDWGFGDIFKLRGWLTFLEFEHGSFIVKQDRYAFDYYKTQAGRLGIDLIDNSDHSDTKNHLAAYLKCEPDDDIVQTIRWSFRVERDLLRRLKTFKNQHKDKKGYFALDKYYYRVNSETLFFSADPMSRIHSLFKAYVDNRNITAKISLEESGGNFDDDVDTITESAFKNTYYKAEINIYQVSILVEHLTRVAVLKCCIEHLIDRLRGAYDAGSIEAVFDDLMLPKNLQGGLTEIIKDEYFHLYPSFWQFFTYVLGGFILLDFEEAELDVLSRATQIPLEHIPAAFEAFNKLFPRPNGWFHFYYNSQIKAHHLFPIAISGIGANYRRLLHTDDHKYETLSKTLTGEYTQRNLLKWNNLSYQILS